MGKKLIGSVGLAPGTDTGFDLTTKGDTHGYSTTNARIPVGTNNYSVLADSAQALGLKWGASATSILSSTGAILSASSANVLIAITPSTSGHVLTSNGATTLPTFQAVAGGATTATASDTITSSFTSSSTSYTDITDWTLSKPNISGGKCMTTAFTSYEGDTLNHNFSLVMEDDGVIVSRVTSTITKVNTPLPGFSLSDVSDSDGTTIQMQGKITGGDFQIKYVADDSIPKIVSFGVG